MVGLVALMAPRSGTGGCARMSSLLPDQFRAQNMDFWVQLDQPIHSSRAQINAAGVSVKIYTNQGRRSLSECHDPCARIPLIFR